MQSTGERVLRVLTELVALDTTNPPGNEGVAAGFLAKVFSSAGLETSLVPVAEQRANLIVRLPGKRPGPAQLWLGHLDTVPIGEAAWADPPFTLTVRHGFATGRGVSDMKGGVAAMAVAVLTLAETLSSLPQDLYLCLTCDEEAGGLGAHRLLSEPWLRQVGGLVVGEPTDLSLGIAEKGALWLDFETVGVAAHGAAPEEGVNAIGHMLRIMVGLSHLDVSAESHALLGRSTLSYGTIQGGVKTNIVPERCRLTADLRLLPGETHADWLGRIQDMLNGLALSDPSFKATVTPANYHPPLETPTESTLVEAALAAGTRVFGTAPPFTGVKFFTDAAVITPATGIPAIIIGPGDPSQAHRVNERISVERLCQAVDFYLALAQQPWPSADSQA